jgi:hypothetical protein
MEIFLGLSLGIGRGRLHQGEGSGRSFCSSTKVLRNEGNDRMGLVLYRQENQETFEEAKCEER